METTTKTEDLATRYVGKCPICEGDFKLTPDTNVLVHHGYRRPGDGAIHGDCYAVGHVPYEVSCEVTKEYRGMVEGNVTAAEKRLKALESGEVKELTEVSLVSREIRTYRVGDVVWPQQLSYAISEVKYRIRNLKAEVSRLTRLIDGWEPKPVRTFEEDVKRKTAETEAKRATKKAEKDAKVKAKIESFQKRVDSSVRTQNANSLENIFESIRYNLPGIIGAGTTKAEALEAVGRNHVWMALGLMTADGEIAPQAQYNAIRVAITRDEFVWPAALGAPKKGKKK